MAGGRSITIDIYAKEAAREAAEKAAKEAAEEKRQSARRMLTRGETNLKQIAEDLNLSIEEVEAVKSSMQ